MRHDGTDKAERERGAEVCARADAALPPIVDMGAVTTHRARHGLLLTVVGQIEGHSLLPNTVKTTKVRARSAAARGARRERGDRRRTLPAQHLRRRCGGGACHRRADRGHEEADRFARARRGHSIGVPLAVAPKRSLIAPSASMTVHPIRTNGTLIAAPQTYHYFDRLQERIVRFVTKNSGISEKKLLALMLAAEDMAADVGSIPLRRGGGGGRPHRPRWHARRRLRGALHAHRRGRAAANRAETRGAGKMKEERRRASFYTLFIIRS